MKVFIFWLFLLVSLFTNVLNARAAVIPSPAANLSPHVGQEFPGVPRSTLYEVTVLEKDEPRHLNVFQSSCPKYQAGYLGMRPVDQNPFRMFAGRSISWVNFSFSNAATVEIRLLEKEALLTNVSIKILPSRYHVVPTITGNLIHFILTQPGQYSVEIGEKGYQHGLVLFADPPETNQPDFTSSNYYHSSQTNAVALDLVSSNYSGIFFEPGLHDIGVYRVPSHITNIYFAPDSWVYGALIFDHHPAAHVFGRGVLSEARLNYRQSHVIEAVNHSDKIDLEGIVLADTKFFAVRLLGTNNNVQWIKILGGWTYNTDGIAAFGGSTVTHCFIWANDDSIKPYASDLNISDCVVWQLNNGAVIQLGWGNDKATNVTIRHVDVLHAEWNNDAANRGVVSCIGDKFGLGTLSSWQRHFLIEDVVTETPVPFIFNIRPNPASPDQMEDITFKDWQVRMDMTLGWLNRIAGGRDHSFREFAFDNVVINNVRLTESNWKATGRFATNNLTPPVFR